MVPHAPVGRCAALLVLLGLTVAVLVLAHTAWSGDGATPADAQSARTDEARRAVVLAVQRDHRLHVFDAATLEPLGSIRVHNLADSVEARPDGGMLFIRQADTTDGNGCCGLFALDLGTREMCRLITPSSRVPLTDNGRVFNQRGNAGIEVFDASTLERLPTIAAPGVYNLLPSPDGRWLFGINRFRGTTVDLVDALGGTLLRRLPVRLPDGDGDGREPAGWVTGAWLDGRFILYAAEGGSASLWTLTPDTEELGPLMSVTAATPGLAEAVARHTLPMLVSSGGRLLLYDARAWWFKVGGESGALGAGLFLLDPLRALVTAQPAGEVELAQVVAGSEGRLFGLDAGEPRHGRPVRLLALDAETGAVLSERPLADDVWQITAATIPEDLLPRGETESAACSRPEPSPPPRSPAIVPRR